MATVPETVERVFKPIQQFTRGWMIADATDAYGVELGFRTGRQFWVVGRSGVLGDCPWQVAAGALAFHAPHHVEEAWAAIPRGLSALDVVDHYSGRIHEWRERVLTPSFDHGALETIDVLGRRIADAAPAALGALFTGWHIRPRPQDIGARVALTTHVLREMRAAAHINAVIACGITPLDAILASTNAPPRTGPGYAESMGLQGPFRDPEEVRAQRLEAETLTAYILEPYLAELGQLCRAEFGEVVQSTRNAIDM
ncbi:MAG: hypothetical protein O3C27_13030 [Actinomycetota bacterium]|nr:hypothetical protein [Actinomycetota bacterium]